MTGATSTLAVTSANVRLRRISGDPGKSTQHPPPTLPLSSPTSVINFPSFPRSIPPADPLSQRSHPRSQRSHPGEKGLERSQVPLGALRTGTGDELEHDHSNGQSEGPFLPTPGPESEWVPGPPTFNSFARISPGWNRRVRFAVCSRVRFRLLGSR